MHSDKPLGLRSYTADCSRYAAIVADDMYASTIKHRYLRTNTRAGRRALLSFPRTRHPCRDSHRHSPRG